MQIGGAKLCSKTSCTDLELALVKMFMKDVLYGLYRIGFTWVGGLDISHLGVFPVESILLNGK